jgi:putative endonuclease
MGRGSKQKSAEENKKIRVSLRQPAPNKFFCYILECADGTFYTGWTIDPERRARQHNSGTGARYTRSRRPVRLVYVEELPDRVTAMKRERAIKSLSRVRKMKLVDSI